MARKGWDSLSESYRNRLQANGISQTAYESGVSLHRARGHVSQVEESFTRRVSRFAKSFVTADTSQEQIVAIREMGRVQGQEYMDYRRKMTRLYERGKFEEAARMYRRRDKRVTGPDSMWWYHGIFGG